MLKDADPRLLQHKACCLKTNRACVCFDDHQNFLMLKKLANTYAYFGYCQWQYSLYKANAKANAKVYFEQYSSLQTSVRSGRLQLLGALSRIRPKRCQEPLPRPSNKGQKNLSSCFLHLKTNSCFYLLYWSEKNSIIKWFIHKRAPAELFLRVRRFFFHLSVISLNRQRKNFLLNIRYKQQLLEILASDRFSAAGNGKMTLVLFLSRLTLESNATDSGVLVVL